MTFMCNIGDFEMIGEKFGLGAYFRPRMSYLLSWPMWGILAHLPHEDMHSQNPLRNGTTM